MSSTIKKDFAYALMEKPGSIVVRRKEIPTIAPNKVLTKVRYCGICGTDMSLFTGKQRVEFPYTPGHEYCGTIEQVGKDVQSFSQGDIVTVNPHFVCKKCFFCKKGLFHLCIERPRRDFFSNGAFAEYVSIDSNYVFKLKKDIALKAATLIEPLSNCLHAIDVFREEQPETVLIVGAGTIGLLILEALRFLHWGDVILVSEIFEYKREIALKLGADVVTDEKSSNVLSEIRKVNEFGVDALIECSGSLDVIQNAFNLVRSGGKVLLVGRTGDHERVNWEPFLIGKREIQVLGRTLNLSKFEEAIEWIARGVVQHPLYFGRVFALTEIDNAFQYAQTGKSIKTLVKCS